MRLYEFTQLDEVLKKVDGKWALVSKSNPKKVLQYYDGPKGQKPSKEWVAKVERRVHAFESEQLDEINWKELGKKAGAAALAGTLAMSPMAAQADYSGAEPSAMQQTSQGLAVAQAGNEFHILDDYGVAFKFSNNVVPTAVGKQTVTIQFEHGPMKQFQYNRGNDAGTMYIPDQGLADYMRNYDGQFLVRWGNNANSAVFNIATK
jgi:hypothetical protein